MADLIEIQGIEERIRKFEKISTENPEMRRRITEVIRKTLASVRKSLSNDAKAGLGMKSDPRDAYKAVRMTVYRRLLGGNINILQNRKTIAGRFYAPPRHPSRRGGNRMKRSDRTTQMMSYEGSGRGFILRFLNAGTLPRYTGGRNGSTEEKVQNFALKHDGRNFRGRIGARNWFGPRSQQELEAAAQNIEKMIDDIIQGVMY